MRKMKKEPMSDRYNIKGAERCFQILDLAIKLDRSISISDVMQKFDVNTNMTPSPINAIFIWFFSSLLRFNRYVQNIFGHPQSQQLFYNL